MTTMASLPSIARLLRPCVALLALTATACPNESSTGDTTTTTTSTSSSTETAACASDPRVQVYAVGLSATSKDGAITIAFVDADPAPPAKGNNTWTVKLTDAGGNPVTGAAIETTAYMPDHGHTSPIKPTATEQSDAGTYEVTPVSLFMPGVWEVTLTVTPASGTATDVTFTFCVAG